MPELITIPPLPPLARTALNFSLERFRLDLGDIHGLAHWVKVWAIGAHLATRTGADLELVALFAVLHDIGREIDCHDTEHGSAAARILRCAGRNYARQQPGRFELLCSTITAHSYGWTDDEPTTAVCWDADRLDLWRVGREPDPRLLSCAVSRRSEIISAARELDESEQVEITVNSWLNAAGYC